MVSIKGRLIPWVAWWRFKGTWQSAEGIRNKIAEQRQTLNPAPPTHLYKKLNIEETQRSGYTVYTVTDKSDAPTRARVLYL
ncbi:hypothetical protein FZEAL_10872, partial [Fusarium zealandicum]